MARKLYDLNPKVETAFISTPEFRKDDLALMVHIYSKILNTDVSKMNFGEICLKIKMGQIPTFDSIRRVRLEMEKKYPELMDKESRKQRMAKVPDYVEYNYNMRNSRNKRECK